MPARASRSLALCLVLLALPLSSMVAQQAPVYPTTRRDSVVDDYFGTKVADPYRWLEDQNSAEVARWVEAENKVTFAYLDQIPLRTAFRTRLTTLWNTPSVGVPSHMAGRLFFRMNTGLQNQSVLYELASLGGKPVMLIDPNTLSADGSVDLASYAPSPDGKYLAFGLSSGGSDWEELHVRDLATGRALADTVHWVKYSGISWTRDGRGFFYTRFPAPPKDQVLTAAALNGKIYYHRVGTSDTADQLIYERPDRPDWYEGASVTDDGRYLFITLNHGTNPENLLYYADLGDPMHPDVGAAIRAVNTSDDAEYGPIGNIGNTVFLETTKDAPNRRIIALDLPDTALAHARTVVPETKNNIQSSLIAGDRVVVQTLEDVQSRVRLYAPGGALVGQVVLPGVGAVEALGGRAGRPELFYAFSSYLAPTTVYRYDFATRRSTAFSPLPRKTPFDASPYETRQVFYHSKDGTRVPMFITARKGVTLDGSHPTILYAYGGFDIATLPAYQPHRGRVAGARRHLRRGQHPRRQRVRRGLAPRRPAGQETERVRRLHRRGRVPDQGEVHVPGAPGHPRLLERRAARRRGGGGAARPLRRGLPGRRRHGHAALSEVQRRHRMGARVRLVRQPGAVQVPDQVLPGPEREARRLLSGHHRDHRRP